MIAFLHRRSQDFRWGMVFFCGLIAVVSFSGWHTYSLFKGLNPSPDNFSFFVKMAQSTVLLKCIMPVIAGSEARKLSKSACYPGLGGSSIPCTLWFA